MNKLFTKIKNLKLFDYHFSYLYLLIVIVGILGFLIENTFRLCTSGIIDSRFQRLPCILIYGIAVVILYIVLGTPSKMRIFSYDLKMSKLKSIITYCITVMAIIMIGESSAGYIFKLLTNKSLWNYSNIFLHIGPYTSIPTSLGFTILIYLFMEYMFVPLLNRFERSNKLITITRLNLTIGVLFLFDFFATCCLLAAGKIDIIWSIQLW